ncbi:cell division protein SepF [Enterococcus termitis]|jgi:cell division inhibitor SepF|uniref:Cell division protein SepF n=1 Tax=Enterococcus termitis TaxID=332950 RepID=A0A1E5H639_9ENTE|nr:cell division protein SepF [Enterococcus termitis]OEG20305.1 cell division protein SepF [Enterococcus termitis]OJG97274.1 cell division inhibitor SepF [Enterococcus termitis]
MSIFSKNALSSFFGLSGEDEYDNYDEYEEQKAVNERPRQTVRQASTQVQRPTVPSGPAEPLTEKPSARYRSTETHQDKKESRQETAFNEKKVVSMRSSNNSNAKRSQDTHSSSRAGKITIIEPRVYSEAMNIAKHIIASDAVLINFHLVEEQQARRIVDFLTGTVYALDGDIQRVGDEIFLCTPSNIEIDSATAQSLAKKQMFDF